MAFCDVHWFSKVLGKQVGTYVILPDAGSPPYAVYYLLHGLSDDHTIWHRRTRIEWYVRDLPLMVVMPDGFRGFYTNNDDGPAYAAYTAEELVGFIDRTFPTAACREKRCVGGLSMGGYGALRLGLGYPDRFVSANSHSGALTVGEQEESDAFNGPERARIFGVNPKGTDHDLFRLARQARDAGNLPHLRIDCGTDDFLIEPNRKFHCDLQNLGIDHEYEEHPGTHSWDYWDEHVQNAIAFHAKHLGIDQ